VNSASRPAGEIGLPIVESIGEVHPLVGSG
jgi:hypothetical protein